MGFCLRWRGRGKWESVEADRGGRGGGFDVLSGEIYDIGGRGWA